MLYCKYCNYYSEMIASPESGQSAFYCKFADYFFPSDVEELEMENPCKAITYQDYLDSLNRDDRIKASA